MAANAEDLRLFYAAHLGDTQVVNATVAPAKVTLTPGRYRVRYRNVTGALRIWAVQGLADAVATAAPPSTPFDIAQFDNVAGDMFVTHTRGTDSANTLSFRTDAGTADIVITRISR